MFWPKGMTLYGMLFGNKNLFSICEPSFRFLYAYIKENLKRFACHPWEGTNKIHTLAVVCGNHLGFTHSPFIPDIKSYLSFSWCAVENLNPHSEASNLLVLIVMAVLKMSTTTNSWCNLSLGYHSTYVT